ncbi:MAG: DUF3667 domain-containing protein [Rubrivivax sp.]|nr:DUF3667 domain-containing protein [Rubrivivax sp.]
MARTELDPSAACPNCGAPFATPRPAFCPDCGQESHVRPPRIGEFLQQFGGAYLATEGALWRTLKLLLFRPGELTRQYLAGRRKHYVLPLRLYLTISVVVLLLLRAVATASIEAPGAIDLQGADMRNVRLDFLAGRAGIKDGVFFCTDLPAWLCRRIQRRIDVEPKSFVREIEQLSLRFVANVGGAMFLLLPAFALWLQWVYRNRRLRYTEHLVFALHVHAFWFTMLALIFADLPWLSSLAAAAVPLYTLLALRRVYGGRWGPLLLRAGVVSVLYGLTLALALGGVAVVALLS